MAQSCPKCGAQLREGSCPVCGADETAQKEPRIIKVADRHRRAYHSPLLRLVISAVMATLCGHAFGGLGAVVGFLVGYYVVY